MQISQSVFDFLNDIKENNNREWFQANKARYEIAHQHMIGFAEALLDEMRTHDLIETPTGKKSLYRIYRDVRFSKNKSPYKSSWSGHFRRSTAALRGGYYYHIEPGNTFVAGGFWGPNKEDLARIRTEIDLDATEFREILTDPLLIKTFGKMGGNQLKTAPKGFPKDHPAIDLLRHKGFVFRHDFPDKTVLSQNFAQKVSNTYQKLRPFFDYMSEVLTTDANGVSII